MPNSTNQRSGRKATDWRLQRKHWPPRKFITRFPVRNEVGRGGRSGAHLTPGLMSVGFDAGLMKRYPASTRVNAVTNDDPWCAAAASCFQESKNWTGQCCCRSGSASGQERCSRYFQVNGFALL
jgi:hypothetical protein